MRFGKALTSVAAAMLLSTTVALAQDEALGQTLFTNVHVFDGVNEERIDGQFLDEETAAMMVEAGVF